MDEDAKVLTGLGDAKVLEIAKSDRAGTYRAIYTVRFEYAVFVLHVFQKKSKSGIATPKPDMDLIKQRLKVATEIVRDRKNAEAKPKINGSKAHGKL